MCMLVPHAYTANTCMHSQHTHTLHTTRACTAYTRIHCIPKCRHVHPNAYICSRVRQKNNTAHVRHRYCAVQILVFATTSVANTAFCKQPASTNIIIEAQQTFKQVHTSTYPKHAYKRTITFTHIYKRPWVHKHTNQYDQVQAKGASTNLLTRTRCPTQASTPSLALHT